MARMTRTCCYMRSNRSDGQLLVQMMTFKFSISAAIPLVLENCPNDRVIPSDFFGILILVKVGGYLLTPIKLQRPTFCPKLVKRVDFRATLFMPQIPDCWRKHVTNFKPVQSLKQKCSRPGIMFTSDASDITPFLNEAPLQAELTRPACQLPSLQKLSYKQSSVSRHGVWGKQKGDQVQRQQF